MDERGFMDERDFMDFMDDMDFMDEMDFMDLMDDMDRVFKLDAWWSIKSIPSISSISSIPLHPSIRSISSIPLHSSISSIPLHPSIRSIPSIPSIRSIPSIPSISCPHHTNKHHQGGHAMRTPSRTRSRKTRTRASALAALTGGLCLALAMPVLADWPQYETSPFEIALAIPAPEDSAGGILCADLTNDGRMDYLVTVPGHIAAYANNGEKLWIKEIDVRVGVSSENVGLPGHNGPGVTAADIDGDGRTEVLFLTNSRVLHVIDGATAEPKWNASPPHPEGSERWEHLIVANFRGEADRDILLQATNAKGYRVGHYLSAYSLADLKEGKYDPLWKRDDFLTCAHNGARIADLNGDGRHNVLGGDIIGPDGELLFKIPLRGHVDAIAAAKVRDDIPGLQVVAVEEGGPQRVFLYNHEGLIWEADYQRWEPQNFAVGHFDLERPGMQIWNRSRFNTHQRPFVFDAFGELIVQYDLADVKPEDWTDGGVEIINTIDWTGERQQLAAATERHKEGDVCIYHPITGEFVERFKATAARMMVADVSGDWREEIIILDVTDGPKLRIFHNPASNPRPDQPRLWERDHYRRAKLTYNYYSP